MTCVFLLYMFLQGRPGRFAMESQWPPGTSQLLPLGSAVYRHRPGTAGGDVKWMGWDAWRLISGFLWDEYGYLTKKTYGLGIIMLINGLIETSCFWFLGADCWYLKSNYVVTTGFAYSRTWYNYGDFTRQYFGDVALMDIYPFTIICYS